MQASDGNLVLYNRFTRALWSSGTGGNPGAYLVLQGSDGNLVIYDASGRNALWSSGTIESAGDSFSLKNDADAVVSGRDERTLWRTGSTDHSLAPGESLSAGSVLYSTNHEYQLAMQGDGNLVFYNDFGRALWDTGTVGNADAYATVQSSDGNLVVYSDTGTPLWDAGTEGNPGDALQVQQDGNLVVYNQAGLAVWNSGVTNHSLLAGESLDGSWSQTIYSPNGQYWLAMQSDGNLVLYNSAGQPIWATGTEGHPGAYLAMQVSDGNLVVYSATGQPLWDAGTEGNPADALQVQADGNLVIYSAGGQAIWQSGTVVGGGGGTVAPTVGVPPWWSGDCDSAGYAGAHRLGAVWHGLVACGPRRLGEGGVDRTVHFFSGAWGEYEWECVELSMRWLYLAYGVHPYPANGNEIVDNYSPADGGGLVRVGNGTAGVAPREGDVLEFASPSENHTAVVTATAVDGAGNGSISVIQQNATATGAGTYSVSGWVVAGVTDWLHRP